MKTLGALAGLILMLAAAPLCAQGKPEEAGLASAGLKRIGDYFRASVAKGEIPGAVVLVSRRGKVALLEAYGDAKVDSVFRIASMTKPITAVAVLMLVEDGRLSLDDPVAKYIPAFAATKVFAIRKNADGTEEFGQEPQVRPMTILDLLRHTSGLTSPDMGFDPVKRSYLSMKLLDSEQTNAEMADKLARLSLLYQPGTHWEYSMSFDLLGRIVEIASGQQLDAFIADRITRPLKMDSTGFGATVWKSGGAGLVSTAGDYGRFLQMLGNGGELDGVRLLSQGSVTLMTANRLPADVEMGADMDRLGAMEPSARWGQGYGLGVAVRTQADRNPMPASVGTYFWPGALGTYFWADPREQLFVVLMLQSQKAKDRCREALQTLVYEALTK